MPLAKVILLDSVGNTGPILSGQNVTPRFSMCFIFTNILTILANYFDIEIQVFSKNIGRDRGNTRMRTCYTPMESKSDLL